MGWWPFGSKNDDALEEAAEMDHVLPILSGVLEVFDDRRLDTRAAVDKLQGKIAALQTYEHTLSHEERIGLNDIVTDLQILVKNPVNYDRDAVRIARKINGFIAERYSRAA